MALPTSGTPMRLTVLFPGRALCSIQGSPGKMFRTHGLRRA